MADSSLARSGIYEIVNTVNGKRYIGSAVNIAQRWRQHRCELAKGRHNPHLRSAWRKHGEAAFEFHVVEFVDDKSNLLAREQYYIDSRKPEYNCARVAGSNLGVKHGKSSRERISQASLRVWSSPGYRKKMSDAHLGQTFSDEHRAKISAATRGRKLSPEHAAIVATKNAERNRSAEHRALMSAFWTGRAKTPEQIEKMAATKKGQHLVLSADHRRKVSEGLLRAYADGKRSRDRPESMRHQIGRSLARLSDDQIREIRKKRLDGAKCKELCAAYGISQSGVSNICNGKTYDWVKAQD